MSSNQKVWFDDISTIVGHLIPNPFLYWIYNFKIDFADNILKQKVEFFLHTVKWFYLISNNSVKHKYTAFYLLTVSHLLQYSFFTHN